MEKHVGKKTFWAVVLLMVGAMLSKISGFAREIIFAHQFGAGAIGDAFMLTRSLPDLLFSAITIAINTNFIPMYMEQSNEHQRQRFASNVLSVCFVASLAGCLLLNLFPRQVVWLFAASLPEDTVSYAVVLLRIIAFSLVPTILACVFQAFSQANQQFLSTALTGLVTNSILCAAFFMTTDKTYYILAIGVVLAQLLLMVMMTYSARTAGFRYYRILNFRDPAIKTMVLLTVPVLAENLAWNMCVLVDRNIGAYLGTGIIASMAYGNLFSSMTGALITTSVTTAIFPVLSKLSAENSMDEFMLVFRKYLCILCYALCPISVFLCLFSEDVVRCVLEHGALHASEAKVIAECAACYAVGILPAGIQTLLVKGFYTLRDTKTPTYAGVLSLLCNMGFSIWSARIWGHIGVTLSTSAAFFIGSALLAYLFQREYGFSVFKSIHADLGSCFLLAAVPAFSVYWLFRIVSVTDSLPVRVVTESIMFFALYATLLFMTHKELFWQIISIVRRR